jgi:hypothetical protein
MTSFELTEPGEGDLALVRCASRASHALDRLVPNDRPGPTMWVPGRRHVQVIDHAAETSKEHLVADPLSALCAPMRTSTPTPVTQSKNPALPGRVLVARTTWLVRSARRTQPPFAPTVTSTRTGGEREMATRNTRQTGTKAAKAASKVLSNPKSSKAAKSAAASALSQTPKRK